MQEVLIIYILGTENSGVLAILLAYQCYCCYYYGFFQIVVSSSHNSPEQLEGLMAFFLDLSHVNVCLKQRWYGGFC